MSPKTCALGRRPPRASQPSRAERELLRRPSTVRRVYGVKGLLVLDDAGCTVEAENVATASAKGHRHRFVVTHPTRGERVLAANSRTAHDGWVRSIRAAIQRSNRLLPPATLKGSAAAAVAASRLSGGGKSAKTLSTPTPPAAPPPPSEGQDELDAIDEDGDGTAVQSRRMNARDVRRRSTVVEQVGAGACGGGGRWALGRSPLYLCPSLSLRKLPALFASEPGLYTLLLSSRTSSPSTAGASRKPAAPHGAPRPRSRSHTSHSRSRSRARSWRASAMRTRASIRSRARPATS